jgi:hypothetical protein
MEYNGGISRIRAYGATSGSGILAFNVAGGGDSTDSEALRIDSSGRVLINTTNNSNGHISSSNLAVEGADLAIFKDSGGDNASVSGHKLKFVTQSGSLGEIDVLSEGGGGPAGRGGSMRFYTKANNTSSATERLRITSDGEVKCVGADDNKGFAVYTSATQKVAELIEHSADGELRLYTGESTPVLRSVITSYGYSYINANGTNRFGIGTASPSNTCHIKSNNEHQLYVESIDGGAGGSMKVYSPTYAYYCSQNTGREWRWGNYGGSAFIMRDNTGTANVFEIDTAGRIKVPASNFYGARATNSITSAQGVASGDIMYIRGSAATSNSAFDMFTIGNLGGNQTMHIEISFHHSGGGTHGSFMRADYGLNSYTNIDTFQNYAYNFGGGGGFSVTRPAAGDFKVSYNGSSSFHQNFQLMAKVWCGRNTPRTNMTLTDSAGGQHSFSCTALLNY